MEDALGAEKAGDCGCTEGGSRAAKPPLGLLDVCRKAKHTTIVANNKMAHATAANRRFHWSLSR